MESSFGTRLRMERERQQVSLSDIAEQTKIKLSILEALERDDLSQWPGGIFRRSYVRAYAKAVGLSPDTLLREFLQLYPEPVENVEASLAERAALKRPQSRLGQLIGTAIGSLPPLRRQPAGTALFATPDGVHVDAATAGRPVESAPVMTLADVDTTPGVSVADVETIDSADINVPVGEPEPAVEPVTDVTLPASPPRAPVDMGAVASLCTRLSQALDTCDVLPVLRDAAALIDAVGAVLWTWEPHSGSLAAVLSHGYSDEVLARLPRIRRESDNAIAAAFRAAQSRVVDGSDGMTGALVVPVLGTHGCTGVLAVELRDRGEHDASVHAAVTILAAQLSLLIGAPPMAHAVSA